MTLSPRARRKLVRLLVELRWRRYSRDPARFFAEAVQVKAEGHERGRVPFELYDYQLETLHTLREEQFVAVLKARQLGLTTLMMAYALWMLLFRPGSTVLLVSRDQRTADKALSEQFDFAWQFLPDWLKRRAPRLVTDSNREHVWEFPDGMRSRIVSLPATKTAGAGETASLVIWDEAALATDQEDTFRTLLPTTEAGGSMVVFSTARGGHNRFARLCREAMRGDNEFKFVFHPWMVSRFTNSKAAKVRACPDCKATGLVRGGYCGTCVDLRRYHSRKRSFTDEPWRFHAEYPSTPDEAFAQSGRQRFQGLPPLEEFAEFPLRGFLRETAGRVEFVEDDNGPLRMRTIARDGAPGWAKTVLSIDPSEGVGLDFTAMSAGWIDREGVPQRVAYWHANDIEPVEAARQADLLGRFLKGSDRAAKLVVEKQGGYGDTIIHELVKNLNYPRMYVHRFTGHRKRRLETTVGFPMTPTRRPSVIDRLAQWLVFDADAPTLEGVDPLLRYELGAFVIRDDGKVAADDGMYDDLVMSTAIWLYVLTESVGAATPAPKVEEPQTEQQFNLRSMFEEVERAREAERRVRRRESRQLARSLRGRHR